MPSKDHLIRLSQIMLCYLAILASLYTLYLAKTLFLTIIIALFIALFCDPLVSRLEKLKIPRGIGALLTMISISTCLFLAVSMLKPSAQVWITKMPAIMDQMSQSINEATNTIENNTAVDNVENPTSHINRSTFMPLLKSIFFATPVFLAQSMAAMFMIYFFLVYGQIILLRLIQIKSTFGEKRNVVELFSTIQKELSKYVLTITVINVCLGLSVGVLFYAFGIEDAFLWGAMAAALNFTPYLGPLISACIFSLVSYIQFEQVHMALLIPALYLGINLIESQFITPTFLGSNLNLNPLIVFVWLLIWGWIWGAFGMLIGVPLLVCLSIYLEKTEVLGDWYLLLRNDTSGE